MNKWQRCKKKWYEERFLYGEFKVYDSIVQKMYTDHRENTITFKFMDEYPDIYAYLQQLFCYGENYKVFFTCRRIFNKPSYKALSCKYYTTKTISEKLHGETSNETNYQNTSKN